jgi:hypothetical protein
MTSKIVQFSVESGWLTLLYADGSLWRGKVVSSSGHTWDWQQIKGPLCEIELAPKEEADIL